MQRYCSTAIASVTLALTLSQPATAAQDCFDESARFHNVNPWILRAIAAHESGFKPSTVARNSNGSVDRGLTGINSVHLPELARYGITANDLMDSCKSVFVAGWHLRKKIKKFGNTWVAVGAYHSETPRHRDRYASIIRTIVEYWAAQGLTGQ